MEDVTKWLHEILESHVLPDPRVAKGSLISEESAKSLYWPLKVSREDAQGKQFSTFFGRFEQKWKNSLRLSHF